MTQEILINHSPQETRVAVIQNAQVQEIHIERELERGLVGNIYIGKVTRVLPGMQSAFIDIGLERAAFLHVADLWKKPNEGETISQTRQNALLTPIEKQVFEGQALMVQVIKDPIGSKGARLSTQISLAGRYLVFMPQDDHIGISQKIPLELREGLREKLQNLAQKTVRETEKNNNPKITGGFILRTNAEDAKDNLLEDDMHYLRKAWSIIQKKSLSIPPANILHKELDLPKRVLRDLVSETTQNIKIDSEEIYKEIKTFGEEYMPAAAKLLTHYKGERPIFDLFLVEEEIKSALGRRVELKSGGYLIIDQTEALTTIDVNTGAYVGARTFDDTIFKTNLEAAHAIARQLRLRNMGGIIIIDFIDMLNEQHKQAVLDEFNKQLTFDRIKTHVGEFSSLGLVEMTRKRTSESLAQRLTSPCSQCQGSGRVRTARTIVYDILREVLREAKQFSAKEFKILAPANIIELLMEEESSHLAELSEIIKKPISLQTENTMSHGQYDIILS